MPLSLKLVICLLFVTGSAFCQYSNVLVKYDKDIKDGKYEIACAKLKKIRPETLSKANHALYLCLTAKCYDMNNMPTKAFDSFIRAKKEYLAIDSIERAMEMNIHISYLLSAQENNTNSHKKYDDELLEYVKKSNNLSFKITCYGHLATMSIDEEDYNKSLQYYRKALYLNRTVYNEKKEISLNNNIAVLFSEAFDMPDSALYYLDKNLPYLKKKGDTKALYHHYSNVAAANMHKGNFKKALDILWIAEKLPVSQLVKKRSSNYELMAISYDSLHDYTNAYKYLSINKKFFDSLNVTNQNIAINEIQTKYQTKEKELENTVLKNDNKIQKIWLYSFIALLVGTIIIGFLIFINARKREKIADQDKLIERQKLDKVLKDYELNSIDMMLEGQEKERQRLANDLHDNLGSMLATLKLNFENLKMRKNELKGEENKLYERTDELIEEAYQKVRRLAHAKNAGVFASQGLIPAIVKLAEKISIPGKLQINVIPFGFTDRLDNTLEIAIFRIIQELATNIIKHSRATEATIHLTHHDDNIINIIIEDNGIGFKPDTLIDADGMGLTSIRKKARHLGGTFTIDATPGRGTTIIIDLPV
jgi:signal transduction histidine kinase